jgi:hypothetical protein
VCFYPSKSIVVVNVYPICAQWFLNNDIIVTNCGHTYHVSCIAYYVSFHQCCKVVNCKKVFHLSWLQSIGVQPLSEEALTCLRVKSPMHSSWLQRLKEEAYVVGEFLLEAQN